MAKSQERAYSYTNAKERAESENSAFSASYLRAPAGVKLFKPKVGAYLIDIIPYVVQRDNANPYAQKGNLHWERTFYIHRNIGPARESYLCPALSFGEGGAKPCPICEYRQLMFQSPKPEDNALAKALRPSQRQLFNIIDLKDPTFAIQLWEFSNRNFGELLDSRVRSSEGSDNWDDFFHLEDGLSLKINFDEETMGTRKFVSADSIDFKKRTQQYADDILDEVHDLDALLIEVASEKLEHIFQGAGSASAEPEEQDAPPVRQARRAMRGDAPDPDPVDEAPVEEEVQPVRRASRRGAPPVETAEPEPEQDQVEDEVNETEQPAEEQEPPPPPARRGVARRSAPVEEPPAEEDEPPVTPSARRAAMAPSSSATRQVSRRTAPVEETAPEPPPARRVARRDAAPAQPAARTAAPKADPNWGEFEKVAKPRR